MAVGAYAIVISLQSLTPIVTMLKLLWEEQPPLGYTDRMWAAFASLIVPAAVFAFGAVLIVHPPERLLPREDNGATPAKGTVQTIVFSGVFLIGLLVLANTAPQIVSLAMTYALADTVGRSDLLRIRGMHLWSLAVRMPLAIYLLAGAPNLVRWHVRQLMAQNDAVGPGQPAPPT